MNPYVKKGLIVGLIGFAVGVPVGIAFLLIFSPSDWGPLMVSLHLFLSGVLGGVAIGSSVIYEAESWSVTRCTVSHFLITFGTMAAIGFPMGWYALDDISTYIMFGCMSVGYIMVWLIMYLISKKQTKELDEELKKWKQTQAYRYNENDLP